MRHELFNMNVDELYVSFIDQLICMVPTTKGMNKYAVHPKDTLPSIDSRWRVRFSWSEHTTVQIL